jgi:hypothetical protein
MNRKTLHKIEMELVSICDDFIEQDETVQTIKEAIISKFTDLMSEVEE